MAIDPEGTVATVFADPETALEAERIMNEVNDPLAPFLIDWCEFWTIDTSGDDWLCEPLIARGRAHAMYAGAKTGKSYLILAMCAALATGRPFLDMPGGDPVDVLYLDFEMTAEDIRARLEEFGYGPTDDLSHLHYVLLPSIPPLDTKEGGEAVLTSALIHGCELVVIDTTGRALEGDENDNDAIRAFYRHTGGPLKQAGIAWIRLDHAGKDTGKGQRGASAKNDDVDIVMQLIGQDGGMKVKATHRRMSWFPEMVNITTKTGDDGTVDFKLGDRGIPTGTQTLVSLLNDLNVPLDMSRENVKKLHGEKVAGYRNNVWGAAQRFRRELAEIDAAEALNPSPSGGDGFGNAHPTTDHSTGPEPVRDGANYSVNTHGDGLGTAGTDLPGQGADHPVPVSVSLDTDGAGSDQTTTGTTRQISAFDEIDEEWM